MAAFRATSDVRGATVLVLRVPTTDAERPTTVFLTGDR